MTNREPRDRAALDRLTGSHASRRTVVQGLAWTVPVVAVATSAPAFAASCETFTFGAGSCKCPGQSTPDKYGYWLRICYNCPPDTNAQDTTQVTIVGVSKSNKTPLELTPRTGACAGLPYEIPLNGCTEPLHFTGENSGNFLYIDYTIGDSDQIQRFQIAAPPDCSVVQCQETGTCP